MTVSNWTAADSNRAQEIWSDYQRHHDLSEKAGQTAGIDPASGQIWFGESIQDVIVQRDASSNDALLFFVRVGSATYYRKGKMSFLSIYSGRPGIAKSNCSTATVTVPDPR